MTFERNDWVVLIDDSTGTMPGKADWSKRLKKGQLGKVLDIGEEATHAAYGHWLTVMPYPLTPDHVNAPLSLLSFRFTNLGPTITPLERQLYGIPEEIR